MLEQDYLSSLNKGQKKTESTSVDPRYTVLLLAAIAAIRNHCWGKGQSKWYPASSRTGPADRWKHTPAQADPASVLEGAAQKEARRLTM